MSCYLDTSALAKWYVAEAGSEELAAFMGRPDELLISRLVVVELRCLLARRRRAGLIDEAYEIAAYDRFSRQLMLGYIVERDVGQRQFSDALELIEQLPTVPLRTLDALHLAAARACGAARLATGDRVMAQAAQALGLGVAFFGDAA
jgi:predicted nucleic acid-binding protein